MCVQIPQLRYVTSVRVQIENNNYTVEEKKCFPMNFPTFRSEKKGKSLPRSHRDTGQPKWSQGRSYYAPLLQQEGNL